MQFHKFTLYIAKAQKYIHSLPLSYLIMIGIIILCLIIIMTLLIILSRPIKTTTVHVKSEPIPFAETISNIIPICIYDTHGSIIFKSDIFSIPQITNYTSIQQIISDMVNKGIVFDSMKINDYRFLTPSVIDCQYQGHYFSLIFTTYNNSTIVMYNDDTRKIQIENEIRNLKNILEPLQEAFTMNIVTVGNDMKVINSQHPLLITGREYNTSMIKKYSTLIEVVQYNLQNSKILIIKPFIENILNITKARIEFNLLTIAKTVTRISNTVSHLNHEDIKTVLGFNDKKMNFLVIVIQNMLEEAILLITPVKYTRFNLLALMQRINTTIYNLNEKYLRMECPNVIVEAPEAVIQYILTLIQIINVNEPINFQIESRGNALVINISNIHEEQVNAEYILKLNSINCYATKSSISFELMIV